MAQSDPVEEGVRLARRLGMVLSSTPNRLDLGAKDELERSLLQLVYHVNRQNFLSLVSSIETDHVVPAAMLARSLLEESIRCNWMTNDPQRLTALFNAQRKSVRLIDEACAELGVDPGPFVEPSPFFERPPSEAPADSPDIAYPTIREMLRENDTILRSAGTHWKVETAVYAQYRVLSQLVHSSLLGMIAVVQPESDADLSIGQRLSEPVAALVLHTAAASVFVVASHTVGAFVDEADFSASQCLELLADALEMVNEIVECLAPRHGLTPS